LAEARAMAALADDHIITIYQVGEEGGVPFLVMQLLQGESLEARLRCRTGVGTFPVIEILRMGREIAQGLAAAHERGLIHRDIKPANIWLESNRDHVKILDFGLSRPAKREKGLTETGIILGTPSYMAPEQAAAAPVDERCDLFSLGCVLYRIATGRLPFPGESVLEILRSLALDQPAPPRAANPNMPKSLDRLILSLLAKDAAARPASARAVIAALEKIEHEIGAAAVSLPPSSMTAKGKENRKTDSPGAVPDKVSRIRRGRYVVLTAVLLTLVLIPLGKWYGATIIRVIKNKAQVVIQIDDDRGEVEVVVKDQGGKVIIRTKDREIELTPGEYEVAVNMDGLQFSTKHIELTRGGRKVVDVQVPAGKPTERKLTTPPPEDPKPFVVMHAGGKQPETFATLPEALAKLQANDVVEIRSNGTLKVGDVDVPNAAFTLRAAPGFRPNLHYWGNEKDGRNWFKLGDQPAHIEGCDLFLGKHAYFFDSKGPLTINNCRFDGLDCGFASYRGPKLEMSNSLVLLRSSRDFVGSIKVPLVLFGEPQVTLTNNIIRWGWEAKSNPFRYEAFQTKPAGFVWHQDAGASLTLKKNTISVPTFLSFDNAPFKKPIRVEARENIFQIHEIVVQHGKSKNPPLGLEQSELKEWKSRIRWVAGHNLYWGLEVGFPALNKDNSSTRHFYEIPNLTEWGKLWGKEEDKSVVSPEIPFRWTETLRRGDGRDLDTLRHFREFWGLGAPILPELGPDWDLIGPGEAFHRALAKQGPAVQGDRQHSAEAESRPFLLLRAGQVAGMHTALGEALNATRDGDVIEIRTKDPIKGFTWYTPYSKHVTLRAAPGYQPVVEGDLFVESTSPDPSGVLSLEGLHIHGDSLGTRLRPLRLRQVANCMLDTKGIFAQPEASKEEPAAIVNSYVPGQLNVQLPAGKTLRIVNSVLGNAILHAATEFVTPDGRSFIPDMPEHVLDIEHSMVWLKPVQLLGKIKVQAQHSVFRPGIEEFFRENPSPTGLNWSGSRNFYLSLDGMLTAKLNRVWPSAEEGSYNAAPITLDPEQWRLLPGSPGSGTGPGGKDLGADVAQVAWRPGTVKK
jgi:hypothetical protein